MPLPHLEQSEHMSLFFVPAYIRLRTTASIRTRPFKTWPGGASQQLQHQVGQTLVFTAILLLY